MFRDMIAFTGLPSLNIAIKYFFFLQRNLNKWDFITENDLDEILFPLEQYSVNDFLDFMEETNGFFNQLIFHMELFLTNDKRNQQKWRENLSCLYFMPSNVLQNR